MTYFKKWDNDSHIPSGSILLRFLVCAIPLLTSVGLAYLILLIDDEMPSIGLSTSFVILNILYILVVVFALSKIRSEASYLFRQRWKSFYGETTDGSVAGIIVAGDLDAAPITWLNQLYVKFFWKKVVVLEIDSQAMTNGLRAYPNWRIGFKPKNGNAKLKVQVLTNESIRVRIGPEACIFFAIGLNGKEIELRQVAITTVDDPEYTDLPLH